MNSSSTPEWISRLCEDVQDARFSANLNEDDFNDVLKWLLEREFTTGQSISQSMLRFFDNEDKARQNTFLALDDHLFVFSSDSPFAKLGLSDRAESATVKIRYRRLIQLYHPDKGLAEAAGLSYRAEKINQSYDRIKSGQYVPNQMASTPYRHTTPAPVVPGPPADNGVYRSKISNKIRWALGTPEKVTYVLMSTLVVAALVIIISVYSDNKPIEYSQYGEQAGAQTVSEDKPVTGKSTEKRFVSIADLSDDAASETPVAAKQTKTSVSKPPPSPPKRNVTLSKNDQKQSIDVPESASAKQTKASVSKPPPSPPKLLVTLSKNDQKQSIDEPESSPATTKIHEAPVDTSPVLASVATEKVPTTETEIKLAENQSINDAASETPEAAKQTKTSMPEPSSPPPRRITTLSESDNQQSMDVLVGYVGGMIEGSVSKSLHYVDDIVLVDGKQIRKDELQQAYSNWLDESTQREYKVKVSNVAVHQGLVRISGKTSIRFKYAEREPVRYKGVLHFDIQLDAFGGKIVAITRG